MIAKLRGTIDSVGEDWVILDVQGVGYQLSCSGQTLARLDKPGAPASFHTEMRMREEVPYLYGFVDRAELEWFRTLTTVQGVGAKVALAILSVLAPDALALALAAGDKAALARADGVGPKLAARIAAELKDRAQTQSLRIIVDQAAAPNRLPPAQQPNAEAVSALVNLGYGRAAAFAAVMAIAGKGDLPLGELIRLGLRELSAAAREMNP
ncbi:MAG: holliday junction ATP-dependent helicase RuvA [Rhodospirillales bacterium]|nr:holliday junction ATP-dependent helicase RuvA [Rhodospirillales bacterium]